MEGCVQYPRLQLEDYQHDGLSHQISGELKARRQKNTLSERHNHLEEKEEMLEKEQNIVTQRIEESHTVNVAGDNNKKKGKYFYYGSPLLEETGIWIPVSVPPALENDSKDWNEGVSMDGGYIPDGDLGWGDQVGGDDRELTMWDVLTEMLVAARGRIYAITSGDIRRRTISWLSDEVLDHFWQEMAQTLKEVNFGKVKEILETEPPKWLPDSCASACMLCNARFHPILCSRHHCRFCGGIFCSKCSQGRSLMPKKFRIGDPQRVCDVCCVCLESAQPYLVDQVSRASQLPTHDLTDLSTLRSWLNFPWGQSMEYEIYKASNIIQGYNKVGYWAPEKSIPEAILSQAKGLAILTIAKVGVVMTYNIGTGLVIARRDDGSWSPPSAISSVGIGWGAQAGGELADYIIVLRNTSAIRTFCGNMHFAVGAGLNTAFGVIGRAAEADLRAGNGGYAACYTYSCSKGAFVGCSLEGSMVTTRSLENARFYGNSSLSGSDILLGSLPRPPAATSLYDALSNLFENKRPSNKFRF